MSAIEISGLRKTYGDIVAVDGLSFEVAEGEVYGLLGHNGAGKSTTIEILEGHRERTSGSVSVLGLDPATGGRELRDRIGIVLQSSGTDVELTVRETIELYGSAYRRRRTVDEVLDLVGLDEKADARVASLSGGQKRRLDLGLGIVGCPELLFLDEPTTGFDPAARRRSWEMIQGLCSLGTTVVLTTHYLDEAEHLADRVGVMARGKMVAEGTPAELMSASPTTTISFELPDGVDPDALLVPADTVFGEVGGVTTCVIETAEPTRVLAEVMGAASARGHELTGISVRRPSLEDVFLGFAGERDEEVSEP
ncbi:MAG: ABC transporter [Acidimicrobiaceae bacterium]|nr:ABC transporter [Acidimicrobiaceae bacterium]